MQFLPSFRGLQKPTKNPNEHCVSTLRPVPMARGVLFRYLAERFNPYHGNHCDNPLLLLTTRLPKPFRQAFFAVWAVPTGSCRLCMRPGSVFDHPLFGWSNFNSNKPPTTDVEHRNVYFE
ncbi:hypothetical protein AVEN_124101-1 [Araneus ventricosus]|uniref:Uncharacterized protein n=1 Tax=Araneus ventricosus TaxID=182803 RepID=A0A4Y2EYQ5_ARAVE|nr:hypothetical protein AVEN_124101-1 [Araneus ventricosus]